MEKKGESKATRGIPPKSTCQVQSPPEFDADAEQRQASARDKYRANLESN